MAFLNLDLDFFAHPKCARLVGLIGRDSEVFPLRLWAYTAKYHSVDGKLSGYSPQAIERIVQWGGQPGQCVDALAAVGFIDKIGESDWKVHDWMDYQGHIHSLKLRNKKVAKNRWKNMRKSGSTVDTSGIPKSTSGVPQSLPFQSFPEDSKEKERKPPEKPPADHPPEVPNPKVNGTEPPKKTYGPPKMDLTTRGTSGKLVASGTRVGRMARLNLQAASILTRRGLCYPPSHGSKRVPDIRAGQWGRIFSPPQNPGSLVWRLTMPLKEISDGRK